MASAMEWEKPQIQAAPPAGQPAGQLAPSPVMGYPLSRENSLKAPAAAPAAVVAAPPTLPAPVVAAADNCMTGLFGRVFGRRPAAGDSAGGESAAAARGWAARQAAEPAARHAATSINFEKHRQGTQRAGIPALSFGHHPRAPTITMVQASVVQAVLQLPAPQRHLLLDALHAQPLYSALFDAESAQELVEPTRAVLETLVKSIQALPPAAALAPSPPPAALVAALLVPAASAAAAPDGGAALSLCVTPEYLCYSEGEEHLRLVISLKAQEASAEEAAVSLVCVLDVSGSMSGPRLELAKGTCHFLIDQMRTTDYCAFVAYSCQATEVMPPIKMTPAVRLFAHRVIDALQAEGGTALYAGLIEGIATQRQAGLDDTKLVKAVFMCTDGDATNGPRTADDILPALRLLQPSGEEVTVHTFGYGGGHNAPLLQAIAEAQRGNYYYIKDLSDIPAAYGDAFGGLRSVVATSVKVTVTPLSPTRLTHLSAGISAPGAGTGGAVCTSYNELFAEESRELLALLDLPALVAGGGNGGSGGGGSSSSVAVLVALEYVSPLTGDLVRLEVPVNVVRSPAPTAAARGAPASVVLFTAARFLTAEAIESATKLHTAGDVDAAEALLKGFSMRLRSEHTGADGASAPPPLVDMYLRQVEAVQGGLRRKTASRQEYASFAMSASCGLRSQRTPNAGMTAGLPSSAAYDNEARRESRMSASVSVSAFMSAPAPQRQTMVAFSEAPQVPATPQVRRRAESMVV